MCFCVYLQKIVRLLCDFCAIFVRPTGNTNFILPQKVQKTHQNPWFWWVFLVRPTRFERATYRVGVCHSIQLSAKSCAVSPPNISNLTHAFSSKYTRNHIEFCIFIIPYQIAYFNTIYALQKKFPQNLCDFVRPLLSSIKHSINIFLNVNIHLVNKDYSLFLQLINN